MTEKIQMSSFYGEFPEHMKQKNFNTFFKQDHQKQYELHYQGTDGNIIIERNPDTGEEKMSHVTNDQLQYLIDHELIIIWGDVKNG